MLKTLSIAGLLLCVAVGIGLILSGPSDHESLAAAKAALGRGELDSAARSARRVSRSSPLGPEALLVEGEVAQKQGRMDDAVEIFSAVPRRTAEFLTACSIAGDIRMHQGRFADAEAFWRRALEIEPENDFAHDRLGFLLGLAGRPWESLPFLHRQLQRGDTSLPTLLSIGDIDHVFDVKEQLERFRREAPDDSGPMLGLARVRAAAGDSTDAWRLLEIVTGRKPEWVEARVQQGLLAAERDAAAFSTWLRSASACPGIDDHPGYWLARARAEQRAERLATSARCFWEAARRHPNSVPAHYQLGLTLKRLHREEDARAFLDRAAKLERLVEQLDRIEGHPVPKTMLEIARQVDQLGRPWETWGWTRAAAEASPSSRATLEPVVAKMEGVLRQVGPPIQILESCPANRIDLSSLPLPELPSPLLADNVRKPAVAADREPFRFTDEAALSGLDFTYFNSADPATEGMRMFEFTGGGVGVSDFDRDGWPDVVFTQGTLFPAPPPSAAATPPSDRLFRNRGDGRFADITSASGVTEESYGQGVAWGDLNHDGFDDLYVGNIGANRLLLNNGDGSFTDATRSLSDAGGSGWNTSVLIADLDADGDPDLYTARYLTGENVFAHICRHEGRPRACSPINFEAAEDAFYRSSGAGEWVEQTAETGLTAPNGKGLGLRAVDFDLDGRLELFVANDAVPNFLFVRDPEGANGGGRRGLFREQAFESGVAVDGHGKPQACMGVAADDLNGDGRVDLFITNYYQESNTFYQNLGQLQFRDATPESGLAEPSFNMLGFGTQALDADLDGAPDLVVVNGHVDDFQYRGIPFRMPPQLFAGDGTGRFREVRREAVGEYFSRPSLGRSLALLDWNRDGREDFLVSHLEAPAALLTNRSPAAGHSLSIELVGTTSPRVPFGSQVAVTAEEKTRTRQLTAGGGYQSSNSLVLIFGLGQADRIDRVSVTWPSGAVQVVAAEADSAIVIVEGRGAFTLPRP